MSVSFVDGPAKFRELNLRRTPIFLRVVFDKDGTVDALDMPEDEPKISEGICVYKMVEGTKIAGFTCGHKELGCVQFKGACYRMYEHQPEEKKLRHGGLWRRWVEIEVALNPISGYDEELFKKGNLK